MTHLANAGPGCARHNIQRNTGYIVWLDAKGRRHTHRPDGTETTAA